MKVIVDTSAMTPLLFLLGCEKIGQLSKGIVSSIEYHIEEWTYTHEISSHISHVDSGLPRMKDAALIEYDLTKIYSKIMIKYPKVQQLIEELKNEKVLNIDRIEDLSCKMLQFDCEHIKTKIMENLGNTNKNKGEILSYLLAILIQADLLLIVDYSATGNLLENFTINLKDLNLGRGKLFPWRVCIGDFVVLIEVIMDHIDNKESLNKITNLLIAYFEAVALTKSNASIHQIERLKRFKEELSP